MAVVTTEQQELINSFFANPKSFVSLAQDGVTVGFDNSVLFTKSLKQVIDQSKFEFLARIHKVLKEKYPKLLFKLFKISADGVPQIQVKIYASDDEEGQLAIDNGDLRYPVDEFFNQATVNEITTQIQTHNETRYNQDVSYIVSTEFDSNVNSDNIQSVKGVKIGDDTFTSINLIDMLTESACDRVVTAVIESITQVANGRAILFNFESFKMQGGTGKFEYLLSQNAELLEGRSESTVLTSYNEFPLSIFHDPQSLNFEEQEVQETLGDQEDELAKLTKWYTPEGQEESRRKNVLKMGSMLGSNYMLAQLTAELQKLQGTSQFTLYYLDALTYSNNNFSLQESELYPARVEHAIEVKPALNISDEALKDYMASAQKEKSVGHRLISVPQTDVKITVNENVKEFSKLVKNNAQDNLKDEHASVLAEFDEVDGIISSYELVQTVLSMQDNVEQLGASRTLSRVDKSIDQAHKRRDERNGE